MSRLGFLLLLWVFFLPGIKVYGSSGTSASVDRMSFQPVNMTPGLPTSEVRNLFQDSEGYVWISTYNGLLRYDGYSTVVYKPDGKNTGKSVDGFVNTVAEDGDHRLWIGTHNGLFVLNKQTDQVEPVALPSFYNIEAVACAGNGDLWVGSSRGLYLRRAGSTAFELCDSIMSGSSNPYIDVKSILEDKQGHIWIGTWAQGLLRYNPAEDRFYTYKGLNPSESAHTLFQDEAGNIWIGTWRYGLMKMEHPYDMEHYSFRRYLHDADAPNSLADNIIYTITQERSSGKLWIGSRVGLSILEDESGKGHFTNYLPGNGLPFNEVDALLCSRDGLMWVGMLGGGLYTVNVREKAFAYDPLLSLRKYFPTSSVRSVLQNPDGSLWLGIMGFGLVLYNPDGKEQIIPYQSHPAFAGLPYISTVNDIIRRKRTGEYCFATWDDGVWLFDGRRVRVINRENYPVLSDVCIYSLFEDSGGNLWIGTRAGLFMLDTSERLYSLSELLAENVDECAGSSVFSIAEDREGNVWVATAASGIWKISRSESGRRMNRYDMSRQNAPSVGAMTLCADSYGRVWAGTNGCGLTLYNTAKDCFVPALEETFENGDVIFSMLEDERKDLWLTTNARMYRIHVPSAKGGLPDVHAYTTEDGLQDHIFNRNACCKGEGGILFFGGTHGLNSFYPDSVKYDSTSYPVVITDLKIRDKSVRYLPREEYEEIFADASLDDARHITLSYDRNQFSLEFSILDFINPQLNKYVYKLEGYDREWKPVSARRHFAYYSNLPAGEYEFKVRGANANGVWSSRIRTMSITVLPPLYLSGWAFVLYFLLLLLLAFYLYRVARNRMRMKRAIEMGNIQRQKLEEINHVKLRFFTNITHELLTPLSIISASVDELKLAHPVLRDSLLRISDNTTRLIRLIQQVLEFRKVESDHQRLRVSEGNLTLFLKRSAAAFAPLIRREKLNIVLEGCDVAWCGWFDADKLDKIVYNLLSNAAKYTPSGGTVTLRQWYDADAGVFTFSVNNPGPPIPEEKRARMFERFYEGEYRKFHTIGTGIGLSLTKDLVELHHGTITVTSDERMGNTFTVSLPVKIEAYEEEEREVVSDVDCEICESDTVCEPDGNTGTDSIVAVTESGEPVAENNVTATVLLVEDNVELREVMCRLLATEFHLLEAVNGKEALDILSHETVDIIVADIMMPEMDGLELCRRVKSAFETEHIPVILLTARTSDADKVEGYEVGADGYLCKPLNLPVLQAKIRNLLLKRERSGVDNRKKLVFEAKQLDYTSQDEEFMKKALECVNAHLDDQSFDLVSFVSAMGMSRTNCNDKLKELTGMTPAVFISNVRLQAAYRLIQEKKKIRIADLAYSVGFNDPKYFSLCFRKKFGLSPKECMQQQESV